MKRKRFTPVRIAGKLRDIEVETVRGHTLADVVRKPGKTELLCREGRVVDHMRMARILQCEGLKVPKLQPKRIGSGSRMATARGCRPPAPVAANDLDLAPELWGSASYNL